MRATVLPRVGSPVSWSMRMARARSIAWALPALALLSSAASAQQLSVGTNVNMVGGPASLSLGPPLGIQGDPYLQRQNEPSMACSSRNPVNCLAAANDYRLVGTPGVQDGKVTGDAWIGLFWSHDEGQSWRSTLLPGFPQDATSAGRAFPFRGRDAAADPVVRAGTNGLFYLSGIAFNRNTAPIDDDRDGDEGESGGVFLSLFVDDNNAQTIDAPIRYVRTTQVDDSDADQFLDKPWIAVDVPRAGASTCTIPGDGRVGSQVVPAGNVYIVYAKFNGTGPNAASELIFRRSTNCGATWGPRIRLYTGATTIGQGATLAVDPANGNLLATWREFGTSTPGSRGRIMAAASTDLGQSFGQGVEVVALGAVNPQPLPPDPSQLTSYAFDQPTLPVVGDPSPTARMFRTNGYPTACIDTAGRYRLAWAQRWPTPADDSRVLVSTSADGRAWAAPVPIENYPYRGHQFMPSIACTADRATVVWYDQRYDYAPAVYGPSWFGLLIFDPIPAVPAHTIDVRAAQTDPADANGRAFLPSTQVSRYQWALDTTTNSNTVLGVNGMVQLEYNFVNWPLFAGGQVPFLGDYIDLAPARTFKPPIDPAAGWTFNGDPNDTGVLHAAWTDNRDIVTPAPGVDWTTWAPPGGATCDPLVVSNRNQNVYTSRLSRGLVVGVEGNSRLVPAASTSVPERAFAVFVQNATTATRHFRLATGQPPGGTASFMPGAPLPELIADIAPLSTIARTVFVPASQLSPVVVGVAEVDGSGAPLPGGLTGSAVINSDGTAPPPIDGTVAAVELHTPTISDGLVTTYPNPAYGNPTFVNPTFMNPTFINPTFINPTFINPTFINPTFINPTFINPTFINPTFINPTFINPTFINQPLTTDVTWQVTNAGNVASGFNFSAVLATLPANATYQLIVNRLYSTPGSNDCILGQQLNADIQTVINQPSLQAVTVGNPLAPDVSNATFALASGDSALITLRVFHGGAFDPKSVAAQAASQAANTDGSGSTAKSAPAIGVPTDGVTAEATGPAGATVTYSVTSVDAANTPVPSTCVPASGAAFPIGTTPVTCTATSDGKTATASFTVTVSDTAPPLVNVPAPVVAEATSATGAVVAHSGVSAVDLVEGPIASVSCSPRSATVFPLGQTTVSCSAADSHGNTGTASFTVTVRDTTPPVIAAHPDVTASATTAAGSVVAFTAPVAADSVSGTFAATCLPASGSVFPIGATPVVCTASDEAGNAAVPSSFNVIVSSTANPAVAVLATPCVLWIVNGQTVPVVVFGRIASPTGIASASYRVTDSYGIVNLSGNVSIGAFGLYAFTVPLVASRLPNDTVGRRYVITVTAKSRTGGVSSASAVVVVPRDSR